MWVLYSFLAAIFHALDSATSKKALQREGIINFIGAGIHITAGIMLGIFLLVKTGAIHPQISNVPLFWQATLATVLLEISSMFFQYKALTIADFSYLMPFFSLTAITTIIPSFLAFGEWPSPIGFLGIVIIVAGAIIMNYKNKSIIKKIEEENKRANNQKGLIYFLIALIIASFAPTTIKLSVLASSAISASFIIFLLAGLSFLALSFIFNEYKKIKELFTLKEKKNAILSAIILTGVITAVEWVSMNKAFSLADVSYVMAIKRTMPFFAFLIGYFFFKERKDIAKKILATSLMVLGAILIIIFGH